MAGDVERRGVRQHLEGALAVQRERRVLRRHRRRLHRRRRHQQQVVARERLVVGLAQQARQVLRLGVEVAAVLADEVLAGHHRDLQRARQLVRARAPVGVRIEQARRVQAFPIEAHAVAVHHLRLQAFERDRRPDREAVEVHRDRDLLDDRAEAAQALRRLAHLLHRRRARTTSCWKPSVSTPMRRPATPRPSAAVYLSTRTLYWRGSSPSGPAITSSSSALSATVVVIGPDVVDRRLDRHDAGVGHEAVRRLHAVAAARASAGMRIEPPWSPPIAISISPAPTSAAQPLDEPPAE